MKFFEGQWAGNGWPSIEIDPPDVALLLPVLHFISAACQFDMPPLTDTLDGYIADFELLGSRAMLLLDNWSFSIAFEKPAVRDDVLTRLRTLPPDYFPPRPTVSSWR